MTTIEKIKSKLDGIDANELIERLKLELNIDNNSEIDKDKAQKLLEFSIYDSILLILDVTHLERVKESMYSILINIIKDYWYLSQYDKSIVVEEEGNSADENDMEVTAIKEGDTQVNFSAKANTVSINGIRYATGNINFDTNILREKYKEDLYRHRRLRWG